MNPKLRTGNTREREESVLNSVRYFYFSRAPSSFIASFRPFFESGGPDLAAEWLSRHANLRKRKIPEEGVSSAGKDSDESLASNPDSVPDASLESIRKKASVRKPSASAGSPLKARPKKSSVIPENSEEIVVIADEAPSEEGQIASPSPVVKKESKVSFKKEGVVKVEARGAAKWEPAVLGTSRDPQGEGLTTRPSTATAMVDQLQHSSGEAGHSNPSAGSLVRGLLLPKDRRPPSTRVVVRDSAGPDLTSSGSTRENAGGSLVGTSLREGIAQARNLRATRGGSQEVPDGPAPWVPYEMAGVFGDFVAESHWAGDCYGLFSVPDVDIRRNQLSSRDDLDYLGPPNAESVWVRKRDNETCSALCAGCALYIRWKMGIVQLSAPFWRDLQTAWERHRDSSKVDDVVFFDNGADWRSRRVPEILYTCSLRCLYGPPPRRFAWSKGGTQKKGLNGHGIQLRLRIGVICPFIQAQYCYTGSFQIECSLPLWGVARYY